MTTDEKGSLLQGLLCVMVLGLADRHDDVKIDRNTTEQCVVLTVQVAPEDVGKVIGKQGRTARSLRTILGAAAMKHGIRCELNLTGAAGKAEEAAA